MLTSCLQGSLTISNGYTCKQIGYTKAQVPFIFVQYQSFGECCHRNSADKLHLLEGKV